jgi:hypothetical protein
MKASKFRVQANFSWLERQQCRDNLLTACEQTFNNLFVKCDTTSCFAKLRAISNLFFFIHPVDSYVNENDAWYDLFGGDHDMFNFSLVFKI